MQCGASVTGFDRHLMLDLTVSMMYLDPVDASKDACSMDSTEDNTDSGLEDGDMSQSPDCLDSESVSSSGKLFH